MANYFKSAYQANDMGFSDVTEGLSVQGMRDLVDLIETKLLTGVEKKLEETNSISTAIKAGWQGTSRDVFLEKFSGSIRNIEKDLAAEYKDLISKLGQLMDDYFEQDRRMMDKL